MTTAEILAELEARNVKVAAVGGRLQLEAPPGAMAPWLQAALAEHKAELLASLAPDTGGAQTAPASVETAPAALPDSAAEDVPVSSPPRITPSPPCIFMVVRGWGRRGRGVGPRPRSGPGCGEPDPGIHCAGWCRTRQAVTPQVDRDRGGAEVDVSAQGPSPNSCRGHRARMTQGWAIT
jgi:TubC N-terminal docking domain